MRKFKDRALLCLITLLATLASSCQSADPIPLDPTASAMTDTRTACQKADALWNDKITPSRYAQLPPLSGVGISDLFTLARIFGIPACQPPRFARPCLL